MYKLTETGVQKLATTEFIPSDPANRHWQEYLEWQAKGNTPEAQYTQAELDAIANAKVRQEEYDALEAIGSINQRVALLVEAITLLNDKADGKPIDAAKQAQLKAVAAAAKAIHDNANGKIK